MKDEFRFKKFAIRQDRCAMKVGTDGVLLGAWAGNAFGEKYAVGEGNVNEKFSILDIGTGTGLIALMMAQCFPSAHIDALEIDSSAAMQAIENVQDSCFSSRVNVINQSLQEFDGQQYELIVSNPPFFVNSLKNPNAERTTARHTDTLSFHDLFVGVSKMLTEGGVFAAIIPVEVMEQFCSEAFIQGLFLTNKCLVRTVPRKQPKRCLLAFSNRQALTIDNTECSLMDADGLKSSWYMKITEDFYL